MSVGLTVAGAQPGLVRLDERIRAASGWWWGSVDRFSWYSPRGSVFSGPMTSLGVDLNGIPFDLGGFSVPNINFLPVANSVGVTVYSNPLPRLNAGGQLAKSGSIQVDTDTPASGYSGSFQVALGNESGDPGPYLFTGQATPNVDRLLTDASASIAFRKGDRFLQVQLTAVKSPSSGIEMQKRNAAIVDDWPSLQEIYGGSVTAGWDRGGRVTHRLLIGRSYAPRYFALNTLIGREIPVTSTKDIMAVRSSVRHTDRLYTTWLFMYTNDELDEYSNIYDLDPDWNMSNVLASVHTVLEQSRLRAGAGAYYFQRRFLPRFAPGRSSANEFGLNVSLERLNAKRIRPYLIAVAEYADSQMGFDGVLGIKLYLSPGDSLELALSRISKTAAEQHPFLWFWQKGYAIMEQPGIQSAITGTLEEKRNSVISFDVNWKRSFTDDASMQISAELSRVTDQHLFPARIDFSGEDCTFFRQNKIVPGQHAITADLRAKLNFKRDRLKARISVAATRFVDGTQIYKEVWETVPETWGNMDMQYRLVPQFLIGGTITAFASSYWPDYADIAGSICEINRNSRVVYEAELPGAVIVDFYCRKIVWHERVNLDLILRNVGNQVYRYHPEGTGQALSMLIQANLVLK